MLFATPGLIYEGLAERRRPVLQLTPFREASRIALTSIVFSGIAIAALAWLRATHAALMPNPGAFIRLPSAYFAAHYRLVFRTLLLEVIVASAVAVLVSEVRGIRLRGRRSRPHDALWTVLHETTKTPAVPIVELRMKDDTVFRGELAAIDPAGAVADRFLALAPPIDLRASPLVEAERLSPTRWPRVVLRVDQVLEMYVFFGTRSKRHWRDRARVLWSRFRRSDRSTDGPEPSGAET